MTTTQTPSPIWCDRCYGVTNTTPQGVCASCNLPKLVTCEHEGCEAQFCLVLERTRPGLCIEHADDADRAARGWTPQNSSN